MLKKISVYEHKENHDLHHHFDVDVEEKETKTDVFFTVSDLSEGMHIFRLEAMDSNNIITRQDSLRIYVNIIQN